MRAAVALLLISQLAFGAEWKALTTPQLLEQHEEIESRRPGYGAPGTILTVGIWSIVFGIPLVNLRWTTTVNGMTRQESTTGLGIALISLGVAGVIAGGAWLFSNLRRRNAANEQLEAIEAELDGREKVVDLAKQADLLAMVTAPAFAPFSPSTGGLVVVVTDARGSVPSARVSANGRIYACNDKGAATIDNLPAGPIALKISAPGHVSSDEAASVIVGKRTPVTLTLRANREQQNARLTGVVRSAETGQPVAAQLIVAETSEKVPVDGEGIFRVDLPPGEYTVNISSAGYLTQTKQVRVKGGDRAIFNVDLHQR